MEGSPPPDSLCTEMIGLVYRHNVAICCLICGMGWKIWLAEHLRRWGLHGPWLLARYGYLHERGWFRAYAEGLAIDGQGQPIPWLAYPCIDFLAERLRPDLRVFEYGGGHSTRWLAQRVEHLDSVEHDPAWYGRIRPLVPERVGLRLETDPAAYVQAPARARPPYDLVLVDGIERNACLAGVVPCLSPTGVVVLDNADRSEYDAGVEALHGQGFRRLDFVGLAPASPIATATAILYRDGNCLGI